MLMESRTELPEADFRHGLRSHLALIAEGLGWKPTHWARAAGVAPSTLNRFLNQEVQHLPSTRTLRKLVAAALRRVDTAGDELPVSPESARRAIMNLEILTGMFEREAHPRPDRTLEVTVIGKVEAGAWREALEWSGEDQYSVHVPAVNLRPGVRRYALEVSGDSMNLLYPHGTVLICEDIIDIGREPNHGERVIAQRRDKNGLYETTVKEYQRDAKDRVWLIPQSSNPEFQTPILLSGDASGEHEELRILAVVIGSYRPENQA